MKIHENPFNIGDRVRVIRPDSYDHGGSGTVTAYFDASISQVTQAKTHVCMIQWDDGDWTGYGWKNLQLEVNGVSIMVSLL